MTDHLDRLFLMNDDCLYWKTKISHWKMLIKSFSYLGFDVSLLLLVLSSLKFRWITNWWVDVFGITSGCILVRGSIISRLDITFNFSTVVFVIWIVLPSQVAIVAERFASLFRPYIRFLLLFIIFVRWWTISTTVIVFILIFCWNFTCFFCDIS